jgi:hypothetical protein
MAERLIIRLSGAQSLRLMVGAHQMRARCSGRSIACSSMCRYLPVDRYRSRRSCCLIAGWERGGAGGEREVFSQAEITLLYDTDTPF